MTQDLPQISLDPNTLVKEEVFTDQKVGTIRKLIPVNIDGDVDTSRSAVFLGQTQVMTPAGALPLNFELEGDDLKTAIDSFAVKAQEAMEKTLKEIQEYQRNQASKIVVPGQSDSNIQLP
ncbi:MAG: hypothetical protein OEY19_11170 [Gammaproteobacteria bacterium]|nr:hypothetical protein [Gammaproteobacteria bacterium]MDH5629036.1 hypothetical protein [Gammaproteobacteria bacterium]